jgi:hypothetical protein
MFRMRRKARAVYCSLLVCASVTIGVRASEAKPDATAHAWMQTALDRWENACRQHLRLPIEPLPWVIFYDENAAWHISAEPAFLPAHETTTVTLNFAGQPRALVRVPHNNGLWVPGRAEVLPLKVDLHTSLYDNQQKPYCIIPLPSLFRKLAAADQASILDELFLGIAMHELTHTRQLLFVMAQINRLRNKKGYTLPEHLNDNLLEDTFSKNKDYVRRFKQEMDLLGDAYFANTPAARERLLTRALTLIQQRRTRYFVGKRKAYAPLEEIFLTLEGAGMWAHFRMARDHAPMGEDVPTTLMKLAQRTNAWSQVESLVLFLLIDQLVPNWQARYFAPDPPSPFVTLRAALRQKNARAQTRKQLSRF